MFDMSEKDVLYEVHQYELHRTDIHFYIYVLEAIAGKSEQKFKAVPGDGSKFSTADKFCGFGDTAIAALKDCLSKTKRMSPRIIENSFTRKPSISELKELKPLLYPED